MRQCSVTLTPGFALDDHTRQPRVGLVGRGRDRVAVRDDARIDAPLAVHEQLHSVEAGHDEAGHVDLRDQELDGPTAHDPDPPDRPDQLPQRLDGRRQRHRVVGVIDDRRERAVVVDEDRRFARALGERIDHCVDIEHSATLPVCPHRSRCQAGGA